MEYNFHGKPDGIYFKPSYRFPDQPHFFVGVGRKWDYRWWVWDEPCFGDIRKASVIEEAGAPVEYHWSFWTPDTWAGVLACIKEGRHPLNKHPWGRTWVKHEFR